MRCRALGQWLERLGIDVEFQGEDAEISADWLVVDHYGLDAEWESRARAGARAIMALDDVPSRRHDCDLLLDQNSEAADDAYRPLLPAHCRTLLGPRYALLRAEFAAQRRRMKRGFGKVSRVLVFFGAADRAGWMPGAVEAVRAALPRAHIDAITGAGGTDRMHELMAAADLAVGAAGSATWERCCLGLPAILIATAPNQVAVAATATRAGAARSLGRSEEVARDALVAEIAALAADRAARAKMSEAGMRLVDGKGAQRVGEALFPLDVRIAAEADKRLLWEWANDRAVRDNAFSRDEIPWADHERWFAQRLADARCRIYIGGLGGRPVGQVRFEPEGEGFKVDISLGEGCRGLGLGGPLLEAAIARFLSDHPGASLVANVLRGNAASEALFAAHGFERTDSGPRAASFRRSPA